MHVLYESALTAGLRSSAIKGSFTAEEALRKLLVGTKLSVRYTGSRSYTLVAQSRSTDVAASPAATPRNLPLQRHQFSDFHHYLGGVQAGITARLCADRQTRPSDYRIALRFWINSAGAIQAPTVLKSSGDNLRDEAIAAALSDLRFSEAPPIDMPQPVTMVVAPRTAAARSDCPEAAP
jgi:TonB family protein